MDKKKGKKKRRKGQQKQNGSKKKKTQYRRETKKKKNVKKTGVHMTKNIQTRGRANTRNQRQQHNKDETEGNRRKELFGRKWQNEVE